MKRRVTIVPILATIILSFSLTGCESPPENPSDNSSPPQEQPLDNDNSKEKESYE